MTEEDIEKCFKSMNLKVESSNSNKSEKNKIKENDLDSIEKKIIIKTNELIKTNNEKIENEISLKYSDIPSKKVIDDYILKATYKILKENMKLYYNKIEIDNKMIEYNNLIKEFVENKYKMDKSNINHNNSSSSSISINNNKNNNNLSSSDKEKNLNRKRNIEANEIDLFIKKENERLIEIQNIQSNRV